MTENLPLQANSTVGEYGAALKSVETAQFELAQRQAKILSTSTIIPDHFRGNMGNCYLAVHTAKQLGLDPIQFMQRSFVVHGKLGIEGQLVIALVNARGKYTKPLDWKFEGKEGTDAFKCTCIAHKPQGGIDSVSLTLKEVKGMGWWKNSIWQNMTEQMFCYRTATFLARRYCPEVLMGFATEDELQDVGTTISVENGPSEALNRALDIKEAPDSKEAEETEAE